MLAMDKAAPTVIRGMGLLILSTQVGGSLIYYSGENAIYGGQLLTTPLDTTHLCGMDIVLGPGPVVGPNPLPPDYERVAAQVMDPISVDLGEPLLLRRLAECGRPVDVPSQIDVSRIDLTYLCDDTFVVSNPTLRQLIFRFEVEETGEQGVFTVQAQSQHRLMPRGTGSLRIYYDGQLIRSAVNAGVPCAP